MDLLPALEPAQRPSKFREGIVPGARAAYKRVSVLRHKFNAIPLLQAESLANRFRDRNLSLAGERTGVDIPYHSVRIAFLTFAWNYGDARLLVVTSVFHHARNPTTHRIMKIAYNADVSHKPL